MFSLAALGAALLAAMEMLSFNTSTIEGHKQLISLVHIPIFILIVSITWFVWFYFKTGKLWLALSISALWIIGLILNFIVGDNLTYIELEGLTQIQTFTGELTYIPYGKVNPLGNIGNLASILFVIYVIDATVILARKGYRQKAFLVGFSIVFFMVVAGIQAPLVDYGLIKAAYMVSLPFAAILFAMSIQLTRDVMDMYSLSKEVVAKEARWSKLLNGVKLLVVGIDRTGIVDFVNPYFLETSGFMKEEVIGRDWINSFVPEHSRPKLRESFSLPLDGDIPRHFQNSILTKAGNELIIFWSNVSIENEDGEVLEMYAVGNDITDREKALDKVLELKQQLEVENLALKETIDDSDIVSSIVIKSDASKYAFQMAKEVAKVDTSVLLLGETGVGKGVYARFIHEQSKRADQAFIQVNCAAIPADLLESELFGYEKGAFTGAVKQKEGRFGLADRGTLFLDEIGELPGALQAKLLRVLQSGEFEPLGSERTRKVDVRIIAATNRILQKEVEKGNFREDLYYRINVFPITIPPLRKRKEDIPELIEYFTRLFQKKYEKKITGISKQTYHVLRTYDWPGNIRELQNVIERALISSRGETLKIDVLDGGPVVSKSDVNPNEESGLVKLEEVERAHIMKILEQVNWRIHGEKGAADILDINPSTLRSRMKKLDIRNKRSSAD
jgi:formate hydrogenlyase transcriptional activator